MGCIYSAVDRNDALRPPKAWKMDFSEYNRPLNENDLDEMRTKYWDDRVTNSLEVWDVLHQCCNACLQGDYQKANTLFRDAKLQAANHDLSEVVDEEGQVYSVEKFCYSNPSNMMVGRVEEETTVIAGKTISYHFRLQTTLMDEQKEFELSLSPHTLISSVIVTIKVMLKEQHAVDTVQHVKLIYRGFVLEPEKPLDDYGVNPEYVILA
ncbi:hypothetical protein WA588_003925, partial [Blastocystis sp. NMH]